MEGIDDAAGGGMVRRGALLEELVQFQGEFAAGVAPDATARALGPRFVVDGGGAAGGADIAGGAIQGPGEEVPAVGSGGGGRGRAGGSQGVPGGEDEVDVLAEGGGDVRAGAGGSEIGAEDGALAVTVAELLYFLE